MNINNRNINNIMQLAVDKYNGEVVPPEKIHEMDNEFKRLAMSTKWTHSAILDMFEFYIKTHHYTDAFDITVNCVSLNAK